MRILCLGLLMGWLAFAADATGKWTAAFDTQIGEQKYTFEFKVSGQNLTGKASHAGGGSAISEGRVDEDRISFVENFEFQGMQIRIEYTGKFEGEDKIQFT